MLRYTDHRPMFFPKLFYYKNGVSLPNKENQIKTTEKEQRKLLKIKNGQKPVFEIIRERIKTATEE